MLASCQGCTHRAGGRHGARAALAELAAAAAAVAAPAALLTGCGASGAGGPGASGTGGIWGFLSLALLLAAAGGYAIGSQRKRHAAERALREAHAGQRQWASLAGRGDAWIWQTGSDHQLLSWHGPGMPPRRRSALFDVPAFTDLLRGEQAFAGFRLRTDPPQDGSHGWELRGVPGHDDMGRFSGYIGSARPTDGEDTRSTDAVLAVATALMAHQAAPALLVLQRDGRWTLRHANAAAHAQWPQLAQQQPSADGGGAVPWTAVLALLPALVVQALEEPGAQDASHPSGVPDPVDGWLLCGLGALPGSARAVLLLLRSQQVPTAAAASHGPAAAPDATAAESDNFSFTVSHDLRAPIRVVEGFTRIVKEDYGRLLDRVGNDHLDRVLGAAARMNLMIDALLTLARLSQQPLARQPVNLSQLAGYVVDDLRRGAPDRDCDVEIEAGLSTQGDPTLLRLVLENLLGNAWKYSAKNPKSQISLRATPREGHDGRLAYVVRDNGAGFDMRSADRLFGLFQRLHSASEFPGHGVGLASVRRIVRRHGGEIWAEAEPGKGAAFFFTLA